MFTILYQQYRFLSCILLSCRIGLKTPKGTQCTYYADPFQVIHLQVENSNVFPQQNIQFLEWIEYPCQRNDSLIILIYYGKLAIPSASKYSNVSLIPYKSSQYTQYFQQVIKEKKMRSETRECSSSTIQSIFFLFIQSFYFSKNLVEARERSNTQGNI